MVSGTPSSSPGGDDFFRLLVDAVDEYAIFQLDAGGNVLSWNSGAERIKGYTADEIVGRHFSLFYTPEDQAAGRPQHVLDQALEHGRFEDEGWRVRKDGTRFWADVVITVLRDASGTPVGFAKVTRDMTERRRAEEAQRAHALEQRAREAAEEALRARDRFLSIASHELKTPVTTLLLMAESLRRSANAGLLDESQLERSLTRLTAASQRLGALVDELLDVSRLTSESRQLETQPTDIALLAAEVVDNFAAIDETRRIRLRAPAPAWADVDAPRIMQVVTNLIENAVKYSADGTPVDVEVAERDGGVGIAVMDRGIGIDDEARSHIFEAFTRGANASHHPGLGLGLHICHQIVERHGGRIDAEARDDGGGGSAFRVWLPQHRTAP